jgi:serine/threonine protein kinase
MAAKVPVDKVYTILENLGRYTIVSKEYPFIGISGTFSVVKKAQHKKTGEYFALKIIDKKAVGDKTEMIQTEIDILRKVRHTHIISLHEMFETPTHIYLVMEL